METKKLTLPNLFIAGAQKSASSSLHEYLKQHPDIFMSTPKEVNFFSYDRNYAKGLKYYSKFFEQGEKYKVRGESSIGYMVFPNVVKRIKKDIPNPKFIFILRNPIDRVYSHYWFLKGRAYEDKKFKDAFLFDMANEPNHLIHKHEMFKSYYQFGCSAKWLVKFFETFGKDSILIITQEQLKQDPLPILNRCFTFLNLTPLKELKRVMSENKTPVLDHPKPYPFLMDVVFGVDSILKYFPVFIQKILHKVKNKIVWLIITKLLKSKDSYPKLTLEERKWVADYYKNDVQELRKLTGLTFAEWGKDFPIIESNE